MVAVSAGDGVERFWKVWELIYIRAAQTMNPARGFANMPVTRWMHKQLLFSPIQQYNYVAQQVVETVLQKV